MKTIFFTLCIAFAMTSCSHRIGDLTMMSNRNVEFEKKQIEIKRDVVGKSSKGQIFGIPLGYPNMEDALDDAIKREGTGEYLKNVTVTEYYRWYLLFGVNGIKVKGDLMGYDGQKTKEQASQEESQIKITKMSDPFSVGDSVSWTNFIGKVMVGEIIGKGKEKAIIKTTTNGIEKKSEVLYQS
ncbi:MAG: hypothetical protein EOO88_36680, partial [Pedobacter sp.]